MSANSVLPPTGFTTRAESSEYFAGMGRNELSECQSMLPRLNRRTRDSRSSGRLMSMPETSPTNTGWIWRMDTFMCRLLSPCRLDYNDAVHFGIFVEEMRQGASQRAAFRDVFELAERADAWGIDCVWLGEIHF